MKQDIFSRYDIDSSKRFAIDVSVGRIEELFEDFDSAASYIKKDLDQDFVDYLIESVREIGGYDFVIRINLPTRLQEKYRQKVRKSIKSYFYYMETMQNRNLRYLLWKSFMLFCLGMLLLSLSMLLRENFSRAEVIQELFTEGLTVAAWVSLWHAFANLIFELPGIIKLNRIYRRIVSRKVVFVSPCHPGKDEPVSATENSNRNMKQSPVTTGLA